MCRVSPHRKAQNEKKKNEMSGKNPAVLLYVRWGGRGGGRWKKRQWIRQRGCCAFKEHRQVWLSICMGGRATETGGLTPRVNYCLFSLHPEKDPPPCLGVLSLCILNTILHINSGILVSVVVCSCTVTYDENLRVMFLWKASFTKSKIRLLK